MRQSSRAGPGHSNVAFNYDHHEHPFLRSTREMAVKLDALRQDGLPVESKPY